MAARLPVRLFARHVRSQYSRRAFSSTSYNLEAHNFTMPAMSPTMTEGNISTWKVKEGDSFAAGDILLEIETDKASMDVEAQEDGVMAKIFAGDGSKSVPVGTRIAVIADAGDDVSSIEIPADDSKPVSSADTEAKEQKSEEPAPKSTPEKKKSDSSKKPPKGAGQNPKYPLYPAVQSLIQAKQIPESEAMKIPATGPAGRLLKGDVLAYLGDIESDYSQKQSERITKLTHLDLSNIKVGTKPSASAGAGTEPAILPGDQPEASMPRVTSISLTISLAEVLKVQKRIQDTLGVTMPLSTFLARAVDFANDDLPLPKGSKPSADDLFNAVLGLDTVPVVSRGTYLPQIDALPMSRSSSIPTIPRSSSSQPDIIDVLTGRARPVRSALGRSILIPQQTGPGTTSGLSTARGALNVFSLTVPVGEEKRARTFLERVKTILQVEPGRLVL